MQRDQNHEFILNSPIITENYNNEDDETFHVSNRLNYNSFDTERFIKKPGLVASYPETQTDIHVLSQSEAELLKKEQDYQLELQSYLRGLKEETNSIFIPRLNLVDSDEENTTHHDIKDMIINVRDSSDELNSDSELSNKKESDIDPLENKNKKKSPNRRNTKNIQADVNMMANNLQSMKYNQNMTVGVWQNELPKLSPSQNKEFEGDFFPYRSYAEKKMAQKSLGNQNDQDNRLQNLFKGRNESVNAISEETFTNGKVDYSYQPNEGMSYTSNTNNRNGLQSYSRSTEQVRNGLTRKLSTNRSEHSQNSKTEKDFIHKNIHKLQRPSSKKKYSNIFKKKMEVIELLSPKNEQTNTVLGNHFGNINNEHYQNEINNMKSRFDDNRENLHFYGNNLNGGFLPKQNDLRNSNENFSFVHGFLPDNINHISNDIKANNNIYEFRVKQSNPQTKYFNEYFPPNQQIHSNLNIQENDCYHEKTYPGTMDLYGNNGPYTVLPPISPDHYENFEQNYKEGGYRAHFHSQKNKPTPNYYEYTLSDFKRINKEVKLGGLGPDLQSEEVRLKREKISKQQEYAQKINERNKLVMKTSSGMAKSPDETKPPYSLSNRQLALEFAKKVPVPKVKKQTSITNEESFSKSVSSISLKEKNSKVNSNKIANELNKQRKSPSSSRPNSNNSANELKEQRKGSSRAEHNPSSSRPNSVKSNTSFNPKSDDKSNKESILSDDLTSIENLYQRHLLEKEKTSMLQV